MAAKAELKQTTSTIKNNPVRSVKSVKKAAHRKPQTGSEPQVEMISNEWIAEAAFYKAEARNFEPGHDQEDWLEAEKEYETLMDK